jgi:hypothetical protein
LRKAGSIEPVFFVFGSGYYISRMKTYLYVSIFSLLSLACNSSVNTALEPKEEITSGTEKMEENNNAGAGHWKGSFSNGMKGATISFDVDGKQVKDLTFKGYWRCDGKLELTTIGPSTAYAIKGKAVDGTIKESGFYFEVHGNFNGNKASGTLRFAFVAGGCDTYKLNWTAEKQ